MLSQSLWDSSMKKPFHRNDNPNLKFKNFQFAGTLSLWRQDSSVPVRNKSVVPRTVIVLIMLLWQMYTVML